MSEIVGRQDRPRAEIMKSSSAIITQSGLKSERRWVRIDELQTKDSYHRGVSKAHVAYIVDNWNRELCHDLIVAVNGKGYEIIDGNHRVEAMRQLKIKHCWARIYSATTPELRAVLFLAMNGNKKSLSPIELFNAARDGKEPTAIGICKILEEYGFVVPRNPAPLGTNVTCVTTLVQIYTSKDGPGILTLISKIISESWNATAKERTAREIFCGLYFVLTCRKFIGLLSVEKLVAALKRIEPVQLIAKANLFIAGDRSLSTPKATAVAIREIYNSTMRGKNRLPSLIEV